MSTFESSVDIDNSIFSNNVATRGSCSIRRPGGGVILTVNGSF